ncbi:uncharacterized protein LOC108864598, partial [Galendromus occidentalis]|uniref:Uncharacterized protein LOC108864598 n=1 Tax=Galendromus occidentalis TaxID=34638 RepID=A0AAJ7PAB9_9ACAR
MCFQSNKRGDFWNVREKKFFNISGLLFADDLILIGRNYSELEKLLEITSQFGDEMKLTFNPAKSAVVTFSKCGIGTEKRLQVQGRDIPRDTQYKYLGITVSDSGHYLDAQEDIWAEKSQKVLNQLRARALWGFNRFEISKTLWKAVAVPALTYATGEAYRIRRDVLFNCLADLTYSCPHCYVTRFRTMRICIKTLENKISTAQNEAGRYALGVPGSKVATEFVTGELGWSSFKAREAQSKLRYFNRVKSMHDHRWPKAIVDMMDQCGVRTKAYRRLQELEREFKCDDITLTFTQEGKPLHGILDRAIKGRIREVET